MNLLLQVKLCNNQNYDFVVSNLYKEISTPSETEGEEPIITKEPITDIEGATALLLTDGTSWELTEGQWVQIEQNIDYMINNNVLTFLMSVCHSIKRHFVIPKFSSCFKTASLSIVANETGTILIENLSDLLIQAGDFVWLKNSVGEYLTQVISVDVQAGTVILNTAGYDVRITGKEESIALCFVSFPADFLNVALKMLGYNLFERSGNELKQERLGNYTYTNFSPVEYYGDEGSYPKEYISVIKYYQRVTV